MSDPIRFDEDEQRELEALRERYRRETGHEDAPPDQIDRRIRDAARRNGRRWLFSPFPHNWMVPASVVALLLLTVSIVHFMPTGTGPGEIVITEDQPPRATTAPAPGVPVEKEAEESTTVVNGMMPSREDHDAERRSRAQPGPAQVQSDAAPTAEPPSLMQWHRRIESLLEAGRESEAEDEMRALLERYPDASFESEVLRALAMRLRSEE